LDGDAWYEFDYWAWQFNCKRSRGRRSEMYEGSGGRFPAIPAKVDYGAGLAFGYALRCCEEVGDLRQEVPRAVTASPGAPHTNSDENVGEPRKDLSSAIDVDDVDSSQLDGPSSAEDLLIRTEAIFVGIRAPSRLGVATTTVALNGRGVEEGHPQYAPAASVMLFGYAVRMAQERSIPLPSGEADMLNSLPHRADGALDHDVIANDARALDQLLEYVGTLADDQVRVVRVLGVPPRSGRSLRSWPRISCVETSAATESNAASCLQLKAWRISCVSDVRCASSTNSPTSSPSQRLLSELDQRLFDQFPPDMHGMPRGPSAPSPTPPSSHCWSGPEEPYPRRPLDCPSRRSLLRPACAGRREPKR
jgi:hypothetical protein